MEWLVVIPAAAVAFVVVRLVTGGRLRPGRRLPSEMSVTLSVLPSRTAVVRLDVASDAPPAALASLVDQAVRDAFVLDAVDVVEVRRRDGDLLERRRRGDVLSA
jgi:hypothetical protein